jgi:4a-hydroxytetrahydrobiopterin dehydratase
MAKLDEAGIQQALRQRQAWIRDGQAIRRQFTLGSFADAMAFLVRVGFDAEAADHHPDILVNYKRVTLTFSTHSDGGLTQKDFDGAAKADAVAAAFTSAAH